MLSKRRRIASVGVCSISSRWLPARPAGVTRQTRCRRSTRQPHTRR